ncbi:N-methyltransferase tcpN-like protein [Cladobotryum mycophilum]|uniref:N-methyltransferase tcpN-like protein n=1 Tax=Cladobotryum mycophilum TaxID=491253 RepID=A0ABR0S903_9HYPO
MSADQTFYTLNNGADNLEENRLEHQHGILLEMTKTLIPASIAGHLAMLGRPPVIADIGTGTGIWLRHLATLMPPTSRMDGYDFDMSKFLNPEQLPPNIRLTYGDALRPFPAELLGAYDLVHVRLLAYGLKASQWETTAANLCTLLRPGGYLMWEDIGLTSWQSLPITEHFMKWFNVEVRSPLLLRDQFERVGLINCLQQEFSSFGGSIELRKVAGKALVAVGAQSLHGLVDRGGFEWVQSHSDVDELMNAILMDIDNGVSQVGCSIHRFIGQKPE